MAYWDEYPDDYRAAEIAIITRAARAGDCVSVVGASGAGKSNLRGCMAQRVAAAPIEFVLVDCNRLIDPHAAGFLRLMHLALSQAAPVLETAGFEPLVAAIARRLAAPAGSSTIRCFVLDLSTLAASTGALTGDGWKGLLNNLRALRDAYKYRLTYVTATRHPRPMDNELAELFFGRQVWLGPLAAADARWTVRRYAERQGLSWPPENVAAFIGLSGGNPALLRAACEAHAAGAPLDAAALAQHPAVQRRVQACWDAVPEETELRAAGLDQFDRVMQGRGLRFDTAQLTAIASLLLGYLFARPPEVCEKDDLVRAVWPEDRIYERSVRDDSLAQLVRRLREKIEPDPRRTPLCADRGWAGLSLHAAPSVSDTRCPASGGCGLTGSRSAGSSRKPTGSNANLTQGQMRRSVNHWAGVP